MPERKHSPTHPHRSPLPRWPKLFRPRCGAIVGRSRGLPGFLRGEIQSRTLCGNRFSRSEISWKFGIPGESDVSASFRGRPILGRVPTEGRFGFCPAGRSRSPRFVARAGRRSISRTAIDQVYVNACPPPPQVLHQDTYEEKRCKN